MEEVRKIFVEIEGKYKSAQTIASDTMLTSLNTEKSLRAYVMRLRDEVTRLTDKATKLWGKAEKLGKRNVKLEKRAAELEKESPSWRTN